MIKKRNFKIYLLFALILFIIGLFIYFLFFNNSELILDNQLSLENQDNNRDTSSCLDNFDESTFNILQYTENDNLFSAGRSKFRVLDKFGVFPLFEESKNCQTYKSWYYFEDLLRNFSDNDCGVEYNFDYLWKVTVIPNKIGYKDLESFKEDFDICGVGGDLYPYLISDNYLLFVSSCKVESYDDYNLLEHCENIRNNIEPTLSIP